MANCIYVNSVLAQDQYTCYSLSNTTQREKCLRDSSDDSIRQLLESMPPAERDKIFTAVAEAVNNYLPTQPSAPSQQPSPGSSNVLSVPNTSSQNGASEIDKQLYAQAINSNDMVPCVSIADSSTRKSCITQVALKVKNPASCGLFTEKDDIDICNLYAKAGEQAK